MRISIFPQSLLGAFLVVILPLEAVRSEVVAARGNGLIVVAPTSVFPDATEGSAVVAFDEVQGIRTPIDITVDVQHGSLPIILGGATPLSPGVIPANACLSSHYIHFDPDVVSREKAVFLFDFDVIGLIVTQANLDASAPILGSPATSYPDATVCGSAPTCGLELGFAPGVPGSDSLAALNLPVRGLVAVDVEARNPADNVRVITEAQFCN